MSDISALILNQGIMESALRAVPKTTSAPQPVNNNSSAPASKDQGVYAVEGDSLYKEEMDLNTDGVITNAEMAQYYAKLASDLGDGVSSLQKMPAANVATTAQAANTYAANEATYSAPYTSLIETSA